MKIKSFIDCVYESDLPKQEIKFALVNKLPDYNISANANVLIIKTKHDMYAVKIRKIYKKEDGSIDIDRIHNWIRSLDFVEISQKDIDQLFKKSMGLADYIKVHNQIQELIPPGSNVIFKMPIDVDDII